MSSYDAFVIDCPMPPSVNSLWRSGSGRGGKRQYFLSERYKTWKRVFDSIVMAMVPRPKVAGHFIASITLNANKRKGDADNRAKAVLDALQRCGIIENDSLADSITVRWGYAPEGCNIVLTPVRESVRFAPREPAEAA